MHIQAFRPRYSYFWEMLGFFVFAKIFGLGFVDLLSHARALHSQAL